MRFTLSLAALAAAGSVIATPVNVTPRAAINQAEFFNFEPQACKVLKCIQLIGSAEEIAAAIDDGDLQAIIKAVGGSLSKLCDCAGCIKPLEKFLAKNGVC